MGCLLIPVDGKSIPRSHPFITDDVCFHICYLLIADRSGRPAREDAETRKKSLEGEGGGRERRKKLIRQKVGNEREREWGRERQVERGVCVGGGQSGLKNRHYEDYHSLLIFLLKSHKFKLVVTAGLRMRLARRRGGGGGLHCNPWSGPRQLPALHDAGSLSPCTVHDLRFFFIFRQ